MILDQTASNGSSLPHVAVADGQEQETPRRDPTSAPKAKIMTIARTLRIVAASEKIARAKKPAG
jgi:hypothetical protein